MGRLQKHASRPTPEVGLRLTRGDILAIPIECPLCAAGFEDLHVESRVVAGGTDEHAFFRCDSCDVRFLWPRLNLEDEIRFYRDEFASFMQSREGTESLPLTAQAHRIRNEDLRVERMSRMAADFSHPRRVLEVGCASGFMLLPLQESGHTCVGVEPSGFFREDLNERGLQTYESVDALARDNDDKFDVIFHYFVLEHVGDPLHFLQQQIELLAPGGVLEIELPCGNDALLKVYDLDSFRNFYFQIGHQWVFTPTSLSWLLSKTGLQVEISQRQRYGLANHITWARSGQPGGNSNLASLLGKAVDDSYKNQLVEMGHADTLSAVIRKP